MAIDVYMQLSGLKGESADAGHKDWIECTSVTLGVLQPKSATASSAGGHTAERCEHFDIMITKLADLSSPLLLQICSSGRTLDSARLEFMRADGNGQRVKYFEINLGSVLISSVMPAVREGELMSEHVSLKYAKVNWKYIQQKVSGGACGNTTGSWDLATNKVC